MLIFSPVIHIFLSVSRDTVRGLTQTIKQRERGDVRLLLQNRFFTLIFSMQYVRRHDFTTRKRLFQNQFDQQPTTVTTQRNGFQLSESTQKTITLPETCTFKSTMQESAIYHINQTYEKNEVQLYQTRDFRTKNTWTVTVSWVERTFHFFILHYCNNIGNPVTTRTVPKKLKEVSPQYELNKGT